MGPGQANAEGERWRSKYFETVSELESKEREWRRLEELLRQSIARLTLVTDPADGALLATAERLREVLRRGQPTPDIEPVLIKLAADVARHAQQPAPGPNTGTLELLAEMIDKLPFPAEFGARTRALRRRLEAAGEDPSALARELLALLEEALAAAPPPAAAPTAAAPAVAPAAVNGAPGDSRPGFLSRLLRKGNSDTPIPGVPIELPVQAEPPPPDPLRLCRDVLHLLIIDLLEGRPADRVVLEPRLDTAASEEQMRALAVDLVTILRDLQRRQAEAAAIAERLPPHELLIQLLERLSIPDEFHPRLEAIKTELAPGLTVETAGRALGSVADLISAMRSRVETEKQDLERFLKQLTTNLQELDSSLRATVDSQQQGMKEGLALGDAVEQQMHGIESSVQTATDLSSLKLELRERIETLQRHVETFRQSEEERAQLAEAETKRLAQRLAIMEREAGRLRARVQAERTQALIDPLTGVANRLAYNERVAHEFARWQRYRDPLIFSVWDVDHFKDVNDTYGHQAGDKVLRVIAKLLSSQTRETDFLARYGGEEFILLLPKTQLSAARHVVEKLRAAVQACEFHYKDQPVRITISCGMTEFREGDDPETVFVRADEALYAAKQGGRNRCMFKD